MSAYYNEHDPFAAAWLRALIAENHIAPGDVDERSIEDVSPADLAGYAQCHFFAGIGVWSHALRRAGWPDDRPIWTGSCPCQPFSSAGKGGGFADERHLWPAWHWLVEQRRPDVILGEQVAAKDGLAWFDLVSSDLEGSGYTCGAVDLCAAGFGAPHIRQRNYWLAHSLPAGRSEWWSRPGSGPPASSSTGLLGHPDQGRSGRDARTVSGAEGSPGRRLRGDADRPEPAGYAGHVVDAAGEQAGLPGRARIAGRAGVRFVAHPEHGGLQRTEPVEPAGMRRRPTDQSAASGLLAHDDDERRDGDGAQSGQGGRGEPAHDSVLGHHHHQGLAVGPLAVVEPGALRIEGSTLGASGLVCGRWSGADWIFCRDGKWRPVEPGTFPLAHGAPARVGRLRGYGNAICAPVAQGFVESVMDILDGSA